MFITQKVIDAFNAQIGHEFSNYLKYVAAANWFASQDLKLIAKMYYKQADDERDHAMRFTNFLIDSGAEVVIPPLDPVVSKFESALQAAELILETEVKTTKEINALVALSQAENSPSALQMLQWFVAEQVEEIATANTNLNVIKRSGNNLYMMEAYLAHE
jgi:bacterioferritin B